MNEIQWIALEAIGSILAASIATLALIISLYSYIKPWLNRPKLIVKSKLEKISILQLEKKEPIIITEICLEIENRGKNTANNVVIKYSNILQKLEDVIENNGEYLSGEYRDLYEQIKHRMNEKLRPIIRHKLVYTVGSVPGKDFIIVPLFAVQKNTERISLAVDNIESDEHFNEVLAYNSVFKVKIYSSNHPIIEKEFKYIHNNDPNKIEFKNIK